eukprot:TRINITY_DN291_c0_g1_i3.p1 TRINITY_DN291_c0_g1~~TRINITY_DN291_c0_g1_i3.p1  ORF type:complete len:1007 (-),score=269.67 TRINITY_DN291_c0_g1_i3:612-3632(-)
MAEPVEEFLRDSYLKTADEVLKYFNVNPATGLSDAKIAENRKKYGLNELPPAEATPFWKLVLKQFDDLLVKILLGAAVISLVLATLEEHDEHGTAYIEPLVIGAILIANATVGVMQERNAEEAIEALKEYTAEKAIRVQNGKEVEVDAKELVPGDIVVLKVGALIPADIRLVSFTGSSIAVDEAPLTGESESVEKYLEPVQKATHLNQGKMNILFSGTLISRGSCTGVVVLTGPNTAIGKIQAKITESEDSNTPLQEKLDEFGETLSKVISVICILVWLVNINHFSDPEHGSVIKGGIYYFKIAVALAVAAIPEGLPAVVTTCLALGTRKMAKRNAIVRSLPSVESLGCTTVICSDKTGTLTTNMMTVKRVFVASEGGNQLTDYTVDGTSFDPRGKISAASGVLANPSEQVCLKKMTEIATLCTNSSLKHSKSEDKKDVFSKTGEATEVALLVLAEKIGHGATQPSDPAQTVDFTKSHWTSQYDTMFKLEFDRKRKSMGALVQNRQTKGLSLFVKGAPESVLARCTSILDNKTGQVVELNEKSRKLIMDKFDEYGGGNNALRCLALAYTDKVASPDAIKSAKVEDYEKFESNLVFVGLAGIIDPPRPDVKKSIETCKQAGIRVVVITGDNKKTAEAICRQIGVFTADQDLTNISFDGDQFEHMTPEQKSNAVRRANLFSRTNPSHKSDIVDLLKKDKEVVAMTGDGVNDAPALKAADIGVAMGSGTAVARNASKIVLADDDFSTIVYAVEEGRAIYNNMKQFIRYLISSNIGEVVCIFLTAVTGMPEALIPVQLLWVNLVTDGLPATALGFNPAEKDIMKRKPRSNDDPIVNGWLFFRYVVIGVYVGVATVYGFIWWNMTYENGPLMSWEQLTTHSTCSKEGWTFANGFDCQVFDNNRPSSMSLSILVTVEMFNAMNSVSENQSILTMTPFVNIWLVLAIILSFALHFILLYTPGLALMFSVAPLNWLEWKQVLIISAPVVIVDELLKLFSRLQSASSKAKKSKTD